MSHPARGVHPDLGFSAQSNLNPAATSRFSGCDQKFILTTSKWVGCCHLLPARHASQMSSLLVILPHSADEETEARGVDVTWQGPPSWEVAEWASTLGLMPKSTSSQAGVQLQDAATCGKEPDTELLVSLPGAEPPATPGEPPWAAAVWLAPSLGVVPGPQEPPSWREVFCQEAECGPWSQHPESLLTRLLSGAPHGSLDTSPLATQAINPPAVGPASSAWLAGGDSEEPGKPHTGLPWSAPLSRSFNLT